jgi:hypothetical protein
MEETLKGLAYSFLKATNQRPLVTHQMHMWFFSLPPPHRNLSLRICPSPFSSLYHFLSLCKTLFLKNFPDFLTT